MRITSLEVQNFRGIRNGFFVFPQESNILCIIGPGDSKKSTLLKAIEMVLWPSWNLSIIDSDFYGCDSNKNISIKASFSNVPNKLLTEEKYGLYIRDVEAVIQKEDNDEPKDDKPICITIELSVDSTLEPQWKVICQRLEPKVITQQDRKLLSFGSIGFDYDKDFLWGRESVLQKYIDSKETLKNAYTAAMRNAVKGTDLSELDKVSESLTGAGQLYGVSFAGELTNRILMQNSRFASSVAVFEGDVPFMQRGTGSKRLLSMGMNINATGAETLLLVDEVETGLEPYRISSLINELRKHDNQQVILTTHSPCVITECTVSEIVVITQEDDTFVLKSLKSDDDTDKVTQAILRTSPDAFLCKRLIVCEGKTEKGILRAFDDFLSTECNFRFAHKGVGIALAGGGDNFFTFSYLLKDCGYDVCILMDSDLPSEDEKKRKARNDKGIKVFDWEDGYAIEEQLFKDIPRQCVNALIDIAVQNKSFEHVKMKVEPLLSEGALDFDDDCIVASDEITQSQLLQLGKIAKHKKCEWYKRIDLGELVGNLIFDNYQLIDGESRLKVILEDIKSWVTADETRSNC